MRHFEMIVAVVDDRAGHQHHPSRAIYSARLGGETQTRASHGWRMREQAALASMSRWEQKPDS